MKMTDKSFAVKIDGKVFTGGEIYEMEIEGTSFKLFCGCESGTKYEITGNLKNLEFLSIPNTLERINIKAEKSTEGFVEEMLHKAVLEAQTADQRYLAKLIVDIIRSGG